MLEHKPVHQLLPDVEANQLLSKPFPLHRMTYRKGEKICVSLDPRLDQKTNRFHLIVTVLLLVGQTNSLKDTPFVLHFAGHGCYGRLNQQGQLVLKQLPIPALSVQGEAEVGQSSVETLLPMLWSGQLHESVRRLLYEGFVPMSALVSSMVNAVMRGDNQQYILFNADGSLRTTIKKGQRKGVTFVFESNNPTWHDKVVGFCWIPDYSVEPIVRLGFMAWDDETKQCKSVIGLDQVPGSGVLTLPTISAEFDEGMRPYMTIATPLSPLRWTILDPVGEWFADVAGFLSVPLQLGPQTSFVHMGPESTKLRLSVRLQEDNGNQWRVQVNSEDFNEQTGTCSLTVVLANLTKHDMNLDGVADITVRFDDATPSKNTKTDEDGFALITKFPVNQLGKATIEIHLS